MAGPDRRGDRSGEGVPRPEAVSLLPGRRRRIGVGGRGPRHRSGRARRSRPTALPVQQQQHRRHGVRRWIPVGLRRHHRAAPADRRAHRSAPQHPPRQLADRRVGITRDRRRRCNTAADGPDSRSRVPGAPRRSAVRLAQHHRSRRGTAAGWHGSLAVATASRDLRRALHTPRRFGRPQARTRTGQRPGARIARRADLDDPDPRGRALLATLGPGRHRRRCACHLGPSPVARPGSQCAGGTHPARRGRR